MHISNFSLQESGPCSTNSHPRIALKCPHCPQTFHDMKSLQIHSFVDHEGSSSSPESPLTAHPPPPPPSRPPLAAPPQPPPPPPPHAAPPSAAVTAAAATPTLFNGELLAAARMVNMQQQPLRKAATAAAPSSGASTSSSPPPPNVSLPRQFPNSSNRSRESSVASSSSESEDRAAYTCDLCNTVVASKAAFRQVRQECLFELSSQLNPFSLGVCVQSCANIALPSDGKFCCRSTTFCFPFQHLMTHAAPRPFVCPRCDAGFTLEHQLETHMKLH